MRFNGAADMALAVKLGANVIRNLRAPVACLAGNLLRMHIVRMPANLSQAPRRERKKTNSHGLPINFISLLAPRFTDICPAAFVRRSGFPTFIAAMKL